MNYVVFQVNGDKATYEAATAAYQEAAAKLVPKNIGVIWIYQQDSPNVEGEPEKPELKKICANCAKFSPSTSTCYLYGSYPMGVLPSGTCSSFKLHIIDSKP